jgi:streptogramin lyase
VVSSADPRIGSELLGYRIEALIGRGGMGVVYRARDARLNRNVALKLIAPELASDERFRGRFLAESELAASLEHPNVIPIHAAGEVEGQLVIAMRYVEGSDLKSVLHREGALSPRRALAVCAQVGDALDAASERGLVHRDVKPSNVLLDEKERAYLADFGLTRRLTEQDPLAGPAYSVGTPAYVAPEQLQGDAVDGRADVYSLGCVLYECLTGHTPYPKESELAILWAHLSEPQPRPSKQMAGLPEPIDAVIEKALAKDPADRYSSCSALVEAAADALGVTALPRLAPLYRRSEFLMAAGAAIAGSAALAAVLLSRSGGSAQEGLVRIDPSTGNVRGYPARLGANAVAVGGRAVWVGNTARGTVTRIDPSTGSTREAPTDGTPARVVVHGSNLVVVNGPLDHEVAALDTETLRLIGAASLAGAGYVEPARLAAGHGGVWLANINDNAARALTVGRGLELGDPVTLFTADEWGRNGSFNGIAVGADAVWVTGDALNPVLFRIDARTRAAERIELPFAPRQIAPGTEALWITDQLGNAVWRFDVRTRRSTSVSVGAGPDGVAVGEGAVWVVNALDGTLTKIDERNRDVVDEIELGEGFNEVAVGASGVWAIRRSS